MTQDEGSLVHAFFETWTGQCTPVETDTRHAGSLAHAFEEGVKWKEDGEPLYAAGKNPMLLRPGGSLILVGEEGRDGGTLQEAENEEMEDQRDTRLIYGGSIFAGVNEEAGSWTAEQQVCACVCA